MKLAKFQTGSTIYVGIVDQNQVGLLQLNDEYPDLASILHSVDPVATANGLRNDSPAVDLADVTLLAPIDQQEVWAAGVTYKRSKAARMEESEAAASCYDRVYVSDRPELFMKATPNRVVGDGGSLRIRYDSQWNVPEPELTLVINPQQRIVGYTIGNDMSSRDIEGDNPLYLPQAKCYRQCCGLGPWITLADEMPDLQSVGIRLEIKRNGAVVFSGETAISEMARDCEDLVQWLFRENDFASGAFLLTGTGIIPGNDCTLHADDIVEISIDGIGALRNSIVQRAEQT